VPTPDPDAAHPAWTRFWRRRVVHPLLAQLTQGITPAKIALTLAVGSACALFPILGTATLLCLVVGIALRLNQPLIQMVNALCTIPHLMVVYGLIRLGEFVTGSPPTRLTMSDFVFRAPHTHLRLWVVVRDLWREEGLLVHRLELTAVHAVLAWVIVAPVWIFAVYRVALPPLRRALGRIDDPKPPLQARGGRQSG
jgi:uncharacterized protein (DUF2062 family)